VECDEHLGSHQRLESGPRYLSVEKIFSVKVLLFCLFFVVLFWFWMVFWALLAFGLWCGSAWFVVRFDVG